MPAMDAEVIANGADPNKTAATGVVWLISSLVLAYIVCSDLPVCLKTLGI